MIHRRLRSEKTQEGFVAITVALLSSTVLLVMCAFGVDTARWYVEVERVQEAADAASMAGVTYLPNDFPSAKAAALVSAKKNGYDSADTANVRITVSIGDKPSQLVVTVSSRVANSFAGSFGYRSAWVTRSAIADYTAPAPMGSPCNTFGNEPPSQPAPAAQPAGSALPATPFPNCSSTPRFWAAVEGVSTDKVQGDRFMTHDCSGSSNAGTTYRCSGGVNTEFRPDGYYWAVHVEPTAVGTPIDVQIYDPDFMQTEIDCNKLYSVGSLTNWMNDYTQNDGTSRYQVAGSGNNKTAGFPYCAGDYNPGSNNAPSDPPTTTFVLRHANETRNPKIAVPISGCARQFAGLAAPPTVTQLSEWTDSQRTAQNAKYNPQMAQLFHQWYSLCTFTPDVPGDYYLQVRTDVDTSDATGLSNKNASNKSFQSLIFTPGSAATAPTSDTTSGTGLNSFALRAVPQDTSKAPFIAVAGNESMPILQNGDSPALFNLIRAVPGTKGQYIAFDFFDPADGAGSNGATVQVIAPTDATGSIKSAGSIPDCQHAKDDGSYTSAANCTVTVKNTTHDGQVEHLVIPIPNDYNCGDPAVLGNCWFSVKITFGTGDAVTDFTTWSANIGGDPVRLIQ